MKVHVSARGKNHGLRLARELWRRGALARLVTSAPRAVVLRQGLPAWVVETAPASEMLSRSWAQTSGVQLRRSADEPGLNRAFERRATRFVRPDADVFVGWAGASLGPMRRAAGYGMLRVLECEESHVTARIRNLQATYERLGIEPRLPHASLVEQLLAEYEEAEALAVPSRFVERSFLAEGVPASKLIRLPLGVDVDEFRPAGFESTGSFRVLHSGTVSVRTGCVDLLAAFQDLRRALAETRPGLRPELWFVGRVDPEMEPLIALHAAPEVTFHGVVADSQLQSFYRRASVLCLPAVECRPPTSLAQAMASGLPILATENTGAEEFVRPGLDGWTVPANEPAQLAARLQWLAEHAEERAEMGRRARAHVAESCSWADYGDRALLGYLSLLDEQPPSNRWLSRSA